MKTGFPSKRNFRKGIISFFLIMQAFFAGAQNVSITATPDSGCAPLTVQFSATSDSGFVITSWLWYFNDGSTSVLQNPVHVLNSPGIYTVSLTAQDLLGTTDTAYTTVTVFDSPSISLTGTDASCNGACDGAIDAVVTGGAPPYIYTWSTGATTQDISGLCAGTYSVTVTDSNGCSAGDFMTITEPQPITIQSIIQNVTCFASSDGSASVIVSGGTTPYTFLWSNGSTTQNLTNVSANSYSLTVSDVTLCSATANVTITQPPAIVITYDAVDIVCPNSSIASIDITVTGGVPSYFYQWSNGDNSEDLAGLSAGIYSLTVVDSSSCTVTESVTIAIDSTCVWAGDANADGIANNLDILSIGVAHSFSGPERPNATLTWDAQSCSDWGQNFVSGVNYKHADCNGDSIVSNDDTLAVTLNYGLTHAKFSGQNCGNAPPLYVDLPDTLYPGDTVAAPILFGTAALPVTGLYGVAFSIGYNNNIIDTNSIRITYDDVWLNFQDSSILGFSKDFYFNGNTDVAMSRTDHVNLAQRHGRIGILHFTIKDDVSGKNATTTTLEIFINNTTAIDSAENQLLVCGDADSAVVIIEPNGLKQLKENFGAKIFPNPANEKLFVKTEKPLQRIALYGVHGKMLLEENSAQNFFEINLRELPTGSYVLLLSSGSFSEYHRIIKY